MLDLNGARIQKIGFSYSKWRTQPYYSCARAREMYDRVKADLIKDPWWINKMKDELREEIRAEIMGVPAQLVVAHES